MLRWAVEFPEGEVGKEREGERVDVWAAGVAAASVGREVLCGWWVGGWLAEAGWQVVLVWRGRGAWLAWRGGWRRVAASAGGQFASSTGLERRCHSRPCCLPGLSRCALHTYALTLDITLANETAVVMGQEP